LIFWLVSSAAASFLFGQLFKYAQRRGCNAPVVVSTNYLVLGALLLVYYLVTDGFEPSLPVFKIGIATGIAFILSLLVMTRALEIADVAGVLTAFRLSILLPIGASVFIWSNPITRVQIAGIGMAAAALFLMTRGRSSTAGPSAAGISGNRALLLLSAIFTLQGIGHICINWVHHHGLDPQRMQVLMVVAFTSGGLGSLVVLARRIPVRRKDLYMGTAIGIYNLGALGTMLTALSIVPATVFWSIQGCAVVMLDNFAAQFVWRETLSRPAVVGAALGALAMLLVL